MRLLRVLPLLIVACSENASDVSFDAGPADAGGVPDLCGEMMPCPLQLATPSTEYIFPRGDSDTFTFEVASVGQVINLVVQNDAEFSPVALEVVLFDPTGNAVENARGNEGRQRIELQRIATMVGEHRVVVRDVANDGEDERNPYQVRVDLLSQTDDNEENNDAATATPLPVGMVGSGVIGSQGDEDWFRFTVPSNQLIRISVTAAGDSPVTLTWTLYDPTGVTPIASATESTSTWREQVRAVGSMGGDYLIAIRDDDGSQADLDRVYTLQVDLLPEPDMIDRAAPNETVDTATMLTSGQQVEGFVASLADLDYYAINVTGASANNPRLLLVSAEMADVSPVDLSFLVFTPDPQNPEFLVPVCEDRDGDACRALRVQADGTVRPARLATAHPIFENGTYYILVRDFQDNDADQATRYTLTASVEDEPDASEDFLLDGRDGARVVPTTTPTTGLVIQFAEVQGYISHANDQDWYRFDIPGPVDPSEGQNGDWRIQLELEFPGPTPVELESGFFGARNSYGAFGKACRPRDLENPIPDDDLCQFPDAENAINEVYGEATGGCFVVFQERTSQGPHYFRLRDLRQDDFDLGARYRFRVTITARCPPDYAVCEGDSDARLCGR